MCEHGLRANGRWASVWDDRASAGAFMWRARNLAGAATSLRELTTEAVSAAPRTPCGPPKRHRPSTKQHAVVGFVVAGQVSTHTARRAQAHGHWYRPHMTHEAVLVFSVAVDLKMVLLAVRGSAPPPASVLGRA